MCIFKPGVFLCYKFAFLYTYSKLQPYYIHICLPHVFFLITFLVKQKIFYKVMATLFIMVKYFLNEKFSFIVLIFLYISFVVINIMQGRFQYCQSIKPIYCLTF